MTAIVLSLITLIVLGSVGAMGYARHLQTLRIERARKLVENQEKSQRSVYGLTGLPEAYLKPELKHYLTHSWYNAQKTYIEHCPEPSSRELDQLERAQSALDELGNNGQETESKPPPEFSSSEQAKEIRQLLKSLHLQIKEDYQHRLLNKQQAMQLMDEIKLILNQMSIDFHLSLARQAEIHGDASKALTRYRSALAALKKAGKTHNKPQEQSAIEERIHSLSAKDDEQKRLRNQASEGTLEKGLNEIDTDDFTPKKQW